jgi:hypothetical protein
LTQCQRRLQQNSSRDTKTKSILSYRSWPVVHCAEATPIGKFFLHWIGLLDIADYSK